MTKSRTKTTGKANAPTGFAAAELGAMNGELMAASTQAGQAMMENAAAMNAEMLRFAGERLEANVQRLKALPEITDLGTALSHQSDFMRSAVDAYSVEMPKLLQQTMESYAAIWTPLTKVAKTAAKTQTKTATRAMADADS